MNRLELVSLIGQRLGSRTDLDTEIITNLRWVQETELEGCKEFLAWFLLDPDYSIVLPAGQGSVALGAMLQPDDGAIFRIYPTADPTSVTELALRQRDKGVSHLLTETARPTQLALFHDTLYVDRKADQEYNIYFAAYTREPVLSTDGSTNGWSNNASDWLIAEVVKKMALRLQNPELSKVAGMEATQAKARVWTRTEAFENAGKDYRMGVGRERE